MCEESSKTTPGTGQYSLVLCITAGVSQHISKGDRRWRRNYWLWYFAWTVSSICLWPYSRCAVWAGAVKIYHGDDPTACNAHLSAQPAIEIPALQGKNKAQPRKSRSAARCSKPASEQMVLWNRREHLHAALSFLLGLGSPATETRLSRMRCYGEQNSSCSSDCTDHK